MTYVCAPCIRKHSLPVDTIMTTSGPCEVCWCGSFLHWVPVLQRFEEVEPQLLSWGQQVRCGAFEALGRAGAKTADPRDPLPGEWYRWRHQTGGYDMVVVQADDPKVFRGCYVYFAARSFRYEDAIRGYGSDLRAMFRAERREEFTKPWKCYQDLADHFMGVIAVDAEHLWSLDATHWETVLGEKYHD